MRPSILDLHRRIYSTMKARALNLEGRPSRELQRYRDDQHYYASRPFRLSSENELVEAVQNAHVIYLADFHTFEQNARNLHRLIKVLLNNKQKLALGLELVHTRDQKHLDAYLQGKKNELAFLKAIRYTDVWRFPWSHYRSLLEEARRHHIPVIALNSSGTLEERDRHAAARLAEHIEATPQVPILVLFGELHVLPNKVPQHLIRMHSRPIRYAIIHQNLDEVYWKSQELDCDADIIRFSQNEFSLQSSPPWAKYESMAYWYENLGDDEDIDISKTIIETGKRPMSGDTESDFHMLQHELGRLFQLSISTRDFDVTICDHMGLDFVEHSIEQIAPSSLQRFYLRRLEDGLPFRLPESSRYYCPNYSLNRLAYLAGIRLFQYLLDQHELNYDAVMVHGKSHERFVLLTQEAFIAFLCSKLINPKRKCNLYADLRDELIRKSTRQADKVRLKKILRLMDLPPSASHRLATLVKGLPLTSLHALSISVGHILAESFFRRTRGRLSRSAITSITHSLFQTSFGPESYQLLRQLALPQTTYHHHRKRSF